MPSDLIFPATLAAAGLMSQNQKTLKRGETVAAGLYLRENQHLENAPEPEAGSGCIQAEFAF